jgi:uncharacterized protein
MFATSKAADYWAKKVKPPVASKLRIATYNVENLHPQVGDPDPSNNDRLDRLAQSITSHLGSPDILCLQEVQDNDGPENTGVTDASETLSELVEAIVAQGGPRYVFTDIAPENNVDGGQPGSNIRQAFLYNPEKVKLHEAPKGRADQHTEIVTGKDGVHLSVNPGRIHPDYHCFFDSRKPLVAEFVEKTSGESLFITNVHLVSKAGDPEVRDKQRAIQAATISGFEEDLYNALKANGQDANIMVTGDFNALPSEYPVQLLDGQPFLQNLAKGLENGDYYTYVHRGDKLAIDHIIATGDMSEKLSAEPAKINAGKPDKEAASDHNPVVVNVDLSKSAEKSGEKSTGAQR